MNGRDPGLQPERTALAWQRTALSAGVVALLLVRAGVAADAPLEIAAGILTAGAVLPAAAPGPFPPATAASRRRILAAAAAVGAAGLLLAVQILALR